MNYYNRHIGDYMKDTSHLSLLEHGIYTRLLDIYYSKESALADDQISRLVGARTEDEKESLKSILSEFFVLCDGRWSHKRCDEEIKAYCEKSEKAKASASARWNKPETERNANVMRTHTERNAKAMLPIANSQEPITSNQKKDLKTIVASLPDWVDKNDWEAFVEVRKKIKSPLTHSAAKLCISKLDDLRKSGNDPGKVLQQTIMNGWKTFYPLKNDVGKNGKFSILESIRRSEERDCGFADVLD